MGTKLFPHYLFGNYIVEIAKLFKYTFIGFKATPTADVTPLNVYYGTPAAAFRYFYNKFNGMMVLPVMNFVGVDYRRRYDKECPSQNLRLSDSRSYDPADGTVTVNKPPMHFDVTYQVSLYNNKLRERDKLLHLIHMMFPRGGCSLRWYPDKVNFPDIFLFMPLRLDENFTDETEYEGLEQKETRDQIKTNFNLISSAVVPFDVYRLPAVHKVIIDETVEHEDTRGLIAINREIEFNTYHYEYYAEKIPGITFSGYPSIALNGYYYHTHNSTGKMSFNGNATITT